MKVQGPEGGKNGVGRSYRLGGKVSIGKSVELEAKTSEHLGYLLVSLLELVIPSSFAMGLLHKLILVNLPKALLALLLVNFRVPLGLEVEILLVLSLHIIEDVLKS